MTKLKTELKHVLIHELMPLKVKNENDCFIVAYDGDIIGNDNLLQELENVCHSHYRTEMKHQAELKERYYEADKKARELASELAVAMNEKHSLNEIIHSVKERNKRLSIINHELREMEKQAVKHIEKCSHHDITKDIRGVRAVSRIQLHQDEEKNYTLVCTKCNHKF